MVGSMSRKGNCYDNAPLESFCGTLKTALVFHQHYATRAQARLDIFEYIQVFYNRFRRHSTLGYKKFNLLCYPSAGTREQELINCRICSHRIAKSGDVWPGFSKSRPSEETVIKISFLRASWVAWVLAILGLVVGFLNVTGDESQGFLLAVIALTLAASATTPQPLPRHRLAQHAPDQRPSARQLASGPRSGCLAGRQGCVWVAGLSATS